MSSCAWKELLAVLPPRIREQVERSDHTHLQEIRLRLGQPAQLRFAGEIRTLSVVVEAGDIRQILNLACGYSPWTAHSLSQGFLTLRGGHRIGICGQVLGSGRRGIGEISSINIRICRDFPGISRNLWLLPDSILILGPPGSGKTTLLRDLVRHRAQRENVAVVDERGEIFPPAAEFPRGENTDVITGCGKDRGIEQLLRTMTPQCIALDEITRQEDCHAVIQAGKCGVSILATAHAGALSDLRRRSVYRKLLESGLFDTAVVMKLDKSWRTERISL